MLSTVTPVRASDHIIQVEHRRLLISINPASSLDLGDLLPQILPGDITRFLVSRVGEDDHCWTLYIVAYAEDVDEGYDAETAAFDSYPEASNP